MGELEDWMDGYLNGNGGNSGGGTGDGDYNTGTTVEEAKNQNKPFENDTTITDSCTPANSIRVPAGFKIAEDSATVVEDGIVIEDSDGNQFVWIPAKTGGGATINLSEGGTTTIVYKRTEYTQAGSYSDYSETMPSDEEASVNAWGGYYIGRFEAGDKEATNAKMMREDYLNNQVMEYAEENGIDMSNPDNITEEQMQGLYEFIDEIENEDTITIKKGQAPYGNTSFPNLKSLAEGMDTVQGYTTATTKLVSSYAWDTAINFIQIKNSDYGRNSLEGNYNNSNSFIYTDIAGNTQTGPTGELIPTGQTTAVSNIYDMGGNLWEYTTESYFRVVMNDWILVYRGGSYESYRGNFPAGYRFAINGDYGSETGFRVTLYCSYL